MILAPGYGIAEVSGLYIAGSPLPMELNLLEITYFEVWMRLDTYTCVYEQQEMDALFFLSHSSHTDLLPHLNVLPQNQRD